MTTHGQPGSNGDLPLDAIESARVTLTKAAAEAAEYRDRMKAAYDEAQSAVSRFERALKGLEPPAPKAPKVPRAQSEQDKVKANRRGSYNTGGDKAITQAASGYPTVSDEKQQQVLAVLRRIGEPAAVKAIVDAGQGEVTKSTVSNGLAHLRARGLVRWSGKAMGGGHKYAPFDWEPGTDDEAQGHFGVPAERDA